VHWGFARELLPIAALATAVLGQTPSPAHSEFDVASVKPSAPADDRALVQALPGRLLMQNFSARSLILFAYGVADYQISGGPSWIISERYDIQAKGALNATVQQMEGPMLQALVEDRFKLALHRETKQLPVYELTIANGNAKLLPSKNDNCTAYSADSPPPTAPAPGTIFCGFPRFASSGLNQTLNGAAISIAALAGNLSRWQLHRPILDRTGLTGTFDVHLEWTADPPSGIADTDASSGPSIFTALREQLGLKLQPAKGPVEVLVIDHVEKPSSN
jgi:uncharacterized protein (TIGR03435 family)